MLTATNKGTNMSQEIIATSAGELVVTPGDCCAQVVTESGTISTGPCRLVGAVLISGEVTASLTVECDSAVKLRARIGPNWCAPVMLPLPVYCDGDLAVSLLGTGCEAVVYYAPE